MRRAVLIPLALLALIGFLVFWAGTAWLRMQSRTPDFTTDTTKLQIVIGNDVLDIPANYARIESQRKGETAERLDLMMLWPDGSGYGEERAALFRDEKSKSSRIFITLTKREMNTDMTGRLDTVYRELFDGLPRDVGTTLQLQKLKEGSGYAGEVLVISKDRSWVARCETGVKDAFPTCLRDVHLGQSLTIRYRFARELLDNWRGIEALVVGRIEGFLQA